MDGAQTALQQLCTVYWFPLYAFARAQGKSAHDAEDVTQSFFVHLLSKGVIGRADPAVGKLRSFLLASFRNFMAQDWRNSKSLRRGGGIQFLPIDHADAESRFAALGAEVDPTSLYDRQWALAVLEKVMTRLRSRHSKRGDVVQFDILAPYLDASPDAGDYARAAEQLEITEASVRVAVFRLRKRFRQMLREQILDTLNDPAELDAEFGALFAALSG